MLHPKRPQPLLQPNNPSQLLLRQRNLPSISFHRKLKKGKPTFQLVDEDDKAQQESVPQEEGDDPDLELAKKLSLEAHQEKGEGEGNDADMERAIKLSLDPAFLPQGRAPVGGVTIRDPVSETTPKLPEVVGKGKTKSETEVAAPKGDKDQEAWLDQTLTMKEDQTGSDSGKLHVSLAGPNPEHMDDEFLATAYPKLRVARLEQEMSEVKKTDHSADVLASIKSQVPTAVDKYLGTKLDDAPLKILERHTVELIEKDSMLPGPESVKNQESKKSPKEIIRAKKEQDEDAMDKEVADKVKDHKRKHDSDDDEDDDDNDEGPSAGSNEDRSTKRRRSDSATSGSAQPPSKDDDQSSKKLKESDASTSKQHPALTSTGWQITDTRDVGADSSMHRSDPELEHSEQSSDDIPMQDEGNDSDMEDTDNAHIPKVSTTTWFKPILESERPAIPEPEWTIPLNDFPEPENNWANTYATTYKVPEENNLQRKTYDIGSFIKWFCKRTGKKNAQTKMDECHKLLTNKVDLSNPEGHQILRNIYEPLPLGGPPGDKERRIALSISKLKAARYLDFGLEELVPSLWVESEREYDISAVYGITHWWFRRKEFYINKHSESSDREAVRSQMRILSVISVKVFEKYGYNYLREIILRRADYQEYKISEKDFKNLHPNDFEDLFLLNIQEKLNHLPKTDKTSLHTAVNMWIRNLVIRNRVGDLQLGIESYQTKINLERPNWDAADYYFKEDYLFLSQEPLSYREQK
ncbi:hypothetical protein Tco_0257185 [Tanacetum coccineum]